MKKKFSDSIDIPAGISCEYSAGKITAKKGSDSVSKKIELSYLNVKVSGNQIILSCEEGNKKHFKTIKSYAAHIRNLFSGLDKKFIYKLESCNVHFPMTLKVEGNKLAISNFLGEKKPRYAEILSGVEVDLKGQKITLTAHDKEAAGQTAANFEKATLIRKRDRRVFQDGIFITEKPGDA